jgi:glycosyltransferase involved in cell wall biosynthesis
MISIIVPTRNRPQNVKRLIKSVINTADNVNDIEFVFFVDEDDQLTVPVLSEFTDKIQIKATQGESPKDGIPTSKSFMHNALLQDSVGPIIHQGADDVVYKTKGWDSKVKAAFDRFEDKIALVYAPDGFQNGPVPICTHGFFHRNWIDLIGYINPPYFHIAYGDTWVTEVAEMIGRRVYLEDVVIEHIHPAANKASWDATYTDHLKRTVSDERPIYDSLAYKRKEEAEKLLKYIALFK